MDLDWLSHCGKGEMLGTKPLAMGANNSLLLVDFPHGKAVLKQTKPTGVNRLLNEKYVLEALAPGLGSRVLGFHAQADSLLLEYEPGEHRFNLDAKSAQLLGQLLREVHLTSTTELASKIPTLNWQSYFNENLLAQLAEASRRAPHGLVCDVEDILYRVRQKCKENESIWNESSLVLVHSDLIPLNVVFRAQEVRFIDWELARLDFAEWDICSVRKAFHFVEDSYAQFLQGYGLPINTMRLQLVSLLHYANIVLWRLCSFYVRGEQQEKVEQFMKDLDDELLWLRNALEGGPNADSTSSKF